MREVRQLLSDEQRSACDRETSQVLLDAARTFFSELMKLRGKDGKGRRSDINRNAFAAGLAALLPREDPALDADPLLGADASHARTDADPDSEPLRCVNSSSSDMSAPGRSRRVGLPFPPPAVCPTEPASSRRHHRWRPRQATSIGTSQSGCDVARFLCDCERAV